jgi:hypothetical protein
MVGPAASVPASRSSFSFDKKPASVESVSIIVASRSLSILVEELTNIIYET